MLWGWWNTILDPLSLSPSLFLDRKRGGFVLENTDRITQWNDISGNNNHATAATGSAERPTLGTDGVVFDGISNTLRVDDGINPILSTTTTTTFAVTSSISGEPASAFVGVARYYIRYNISDAVFRFGFPDASTSSQSCVPSAKNLMTVWQQTMYVNGKTTASPTTTTINNVTRTYIGSFDGRDAYLAGTIHAVLVFSRSLTERERISVEKYLANQYGVNL